MITLKKLANELNVSVSTVSKALNNSSEISQQTIEKVKRLASERNYSPNKIALSLKNNRTLTIGVVIPDILNRFYATVLNGIQESADKYGYDIIIFTTKESLAKEMDSLQIFSRGTVDGIIIAISEQTINKNYFTHLQEFSLKKIPIVMFDRVTDKINCDKVIIDDFQTIYNEVQSLHVNGRKKIGFITTIPALNVGKFRANGFRKASFDLNGSFDKNLILKISKSDDKHLKIRNFLQKTKVDSVISGDIVSGVITINIARSLGLTIPDQLSVVGFGDEMISDYSTPRLSTIEQNGNLIGSRSVDLLVDRMNSKWFGLNKNSNKFSTEIIPTNSILGESKDIT